MAKIQKTYGESSNSDLTDQKIIVQRIPQYSAVTLNSGGKITCIGWNGTKGGLVVLACSGTIDVKTGSYIDASCLGYRGGPGCIAHNCTAYQGEGNKGAGIQSLLANGNGGGGGWGANNTPPADEGGGGSGGHKNAGGKGGGKGGAWQGGNGGEVVGIADLSKMFFGGGSGGTAQPQQGTQKSGVAGGGTIYLITNEVKGAGSIYSKGKTSGVSEVAGGAGGSVLIDRNLYTFTGSISVIGGLGTPGAYSMPNGSDGRSKINVNVPSIGCGNGSDGIVTLSSSKTIDSSLKSGGRSYADGINYGVSALTDYTIVTSTTPNGIAIGDLLLLMSVRGSSSKHTNVGNYEILRVGGINIGTKTISLFEVLGGGLMLI